MSERNEKNENKNKNQNTKKNEIVENHLRKKAQNINIITIIAAHVEWEREEKKFQFMNVVYPNFADSAGE